MSDTAATQRVVLITGGVRRIGAALAMRLAKDAIAVVIHASERSASEAQDVVAEIRESGARADCCVADLDDAAQTSQLIEAAGRSFGTIDILVNNASVFQADEIASFDSERFDRHVAINLRAPLLLARHFAAQADPGYDPVIINMLDQRVLAPNPLYLSYMLSKAGLAAATTVLAQALAPRVRVNAIAPGPVLPNANEGHERFDAEVAQVPLERPVSLDAIADALVYLVRAKNVTGQTIAVDSGQRLAWRTPDVLASMGEG